MTRIPLWAWLGASALIAFGILFFFQYKDPMILLFAVIAAGSVFAVALLVTFLGQGGTQVRVRCRACGGLSDESARFCSQCGQPL